MRIQRKLNKWWRTFCKSIGYEHWTWTHITKIILVTYGLKHHWVVSINAPSTICTPNTAVYIDDQNQIVIYKAGGFWL